MLGGGHVSRSAVGFVIEASRRRQGSVDVPKPNFNLEDNTRSTNLGEADLNYSLDAHICPAK